MDYRIYHDESKEGGYWHGMLLVPEQHRERMYGELLDMRQASKHNAPLGIKCVDGARSKLGRLATNWLQYGVAAMASQLKQPVHYKVGFNEYRELRQPLRAKFLLFHKVDDHGDMGYLPDHASKVETTTRMAIKGGLHALFSPTDPVHITRLHFDGHEHHKRNLDKDRIIGRLHALREYCTISTAPDLLVDSSSDHNRVGSQAHIDCQFLQLTDLLVGSFRTLLGPATNPEHRLVAHPVEEILMRYRQGPARMQHSRWNGSFWMSQCQLVEGEWRFNGLEYQPVSSSTASQGVLEF